MIQPISRDWHTTRVENDLRTGGTFVSRMEAKDGSVGFDFAGTYDVRKQERYQFRQVFAPELVHLSPRLYRYLWLHAGPKSTTSYDWGKYKRCRWGVPLGAVKWR